MSNAPLLVIDNLSKYFNTAAGQLHAVDGVSFTLEEGKTLGIVGESGCGKSTTGRCILKLIEPTSGKIIFQGNDITKLSRKEMRPLRQKMQMVFQDPFSSLDPRETVMQLISEPIIEHKLIKGREAIEERTLELMRTVGLAERYANVYPHELDGGPPSAYRHCPRFGDESQNHRLRRACFRVGRFHSGADSEPAQTAAKGFGPDLYLHYP